MNTNQSTTDKAAIRRLLGDCLAPGASKISLALVLFVAVTFGLRADVFGDDGHALGKALSGVDWKKWPNVFLTTPNFRHPSEVFLVHSLLKRREKFWTP